jgi:hypothetical protein
MLSGRASCGLKQSVFDDLLLGCKTQSCRIRCCAYNCKQHSDVLYAYQVKDRVAFNSKTLLFLFTASTLFPRLLRRNLARVRVSKATCLKPHSACVINSRVLVRVSLRT